MASALASPGARGLARSQCSCQCDTARPTYREDTGACVDTVAECRAASFVTGELSETIPFVFLPLPGQLVYPSAYVSLPSVEGGSGAICVVSEVWKNILDTFGFKNFIYTKNIPSNQELFGYYETIEKYFEY